MPFKQFKRLDHIKRDDEPRISLRKDKITFSSAFSNKLKLKEFSKVDFFVDTDKYRLAFKFHNNDKDINAYTLYKNRSNFCVGSRELTNKYKWLKEISFNLPTTKTSFIANYSKHEKLWYINLFPTFEKKISDISNIPTNERGIYRYLKDDEVVYIGRGIIRSRANSPERANWDFDIIQYSIIPDENDQKKWESFYLDRFVENKERLPVYNKLKGQRTNL